MRAGRGLEPQLNKKTIEQFSVYDEQIELIELTYSELLGLAENFKKYGMVYHGTANPELSRQILPPNQTYVISEKGRKKNLDSVFFTQDYKSAEIYAKRAVNSYGGSPRVLKVVPMGEVSVLNDSRGTSVLMASKAVVLSGALERMLRDISSGH